jgi:radical SAM/Cys-rich protein
MARGLPLASAAEQRRLLATRDGFPPFEQTLVSAGIHGLDSTGIEVLQVNVGKLCNQTCAHCHVDAGPDRREVMSRQTAEACIRALAQTAIPTLDITGGAPELNPSFRWLVEQARALGRRVLDRCNLTVLLLAPQAGLARFLADHQVEIVASLPYHRPGQTDAQRGDGVFDKSIEALRRLNALGYGEEGSGLILDLAHNPVGAFLPPRQEAMEVRFKRELALGYGVVFNRLYTMTNLPISRFLEFLIGSGNYESYMRRLVAAFNPAAARQAMCRHTLSVGWDGCLYDCDFNQMIELPVASELPRHVDGFDASRLHARRIMTGNHCYGCTAGAGSSCGGATTT